MRRLWNLTPAIALTAAVALLFAAVALVFYIDHSYKAQKADEVTVQARILASTVTAAMEFNDRKAAQEYVDAIRANPELQAVAIYGANRALFVSYPRNAGQTLPGPGSPPGVEGGALTVAAPIVLPGGKRLGTVYLQTALEPLSSRLLRYVVVGMLALMAALVMAVLGVAQSALAHANQELESRARDLAAANESLRTEAAERHKVEEQLRQSQKMEAVGRLTGGVAHDFNNLLTVIMGSLEMLSRRLPEGDARTRGAVDAAKEGARRAAALTHRLLAFSRQQPLEPRPLDVNKLVAGMSDLLRRTLGETVGIETVLAGGLWRTQADPNQLESAILNLAVNARDAMPDGGRLTIETANTHFDEAYAASHADVTPGQYVMVAVCDTGEGMTPEVVERAFEPFFTTKGTGKGTGLGLSQVWGFLKQSGGHAAIYSELGQGTTVKLYLPRLRGVAESAPPEAKETAAPHPSGRGETILVVEDEEMVRRFSVTTLEEAGYRILEAADGPSGLALLDAHPEVALLFTDVVLAGPLNGRQVADAAQARRPDLRVLFTTGYTRNAIIHHGRLDEGVNLIGKPFTTAALLIRVRAVLDGARSTEAEP